MSPTFEYTHDAARVLRLLVKKGKTWAKDLDTTVEFLEYLAENGLVREDGRMKTGKPGRPPVAWVPVEPIDFKNLPEFEAPEVRTRALASQESIDAVIAEVANSGYGGSCTCVLKSGAGTTEAEIRALNGGCTVPNYVCPALDAVRRRAKLFAPEPAFQEVV